MVAISARGLEKSFDDVHAVRGLDLEVAEGEVFGLLGPNGAGKTTTIRILTTLLRPDAGEVRILGLDASARRREVRASIGVALQETGLDDLATGRELLMLHARLHGVGRDAAAGRTAELLERFDLLGAADRRVGTYSGGMRRKLDLAVALVHRPRVVFLDEPTVGLDPAARAQLWAVVRQLNREEGTTVCLTTHYMEEAERLARRLAIVDQGRVVATGSPAELRRGVGAQVVTVGVEADDGALAKLEPEYRALADVTRVVRMPDALAVHLKAPSAKAADFRAVAEKAGLHVTEVRIAEPSLDDLFLSLTGRGLRQGGST